MSPRLTLVLLVLTGCAAASGYDPKRYAKNDAGAPDPDTAALPAQPKTTIPDPKHSGPPPAPPPPPKAEEEAAPPPPDAGATKPKPKK